MHCYDAAAQYYQVPAIILKAIHRVEGGKRGDRIADANGTFDHGFMQINTCWKPLLHQEQLIHVDVLHLQNQILLP